MRIVIDMNLSPDWIALLQAHGHDVVHWSEVGDRRASDETILKWALAQDRIVFTHDLDFGDILAATQASAPSVLLLRTQDTFPDAIGPLIVQALTSFESELVAGALVAVDHARNRVRVLPIRRS